VRRSNATFALAACLGIVVVTNAAILASAGWIRRGGPSAALTLTERELAMPEFREREDSGLLLSLALGGRAPWPVRRAAERKRYKLEPVANAWFDREKLREIGFDVAMDPADPKAVKHYSRTLPRLAFVALEMDGEAFASWLAGRERSLGLLREQVNKGAAGAKELADAEALLAFDRTSRSRLWVVDAGTDANALRERHPDRKRCAIVKALVGISPIDPAAATRKLEGRVINLLVSEINVPRPLRAHLEPYLPASTAEEVFARERESGPEAPWPPPAPPRYTAVLAFGRGGEPWIESVSPLPAPGQSQP
jgi:hypothetical protein